MHIYILYCTLLYTYSIIYIYAYYIVLYTYIQNNIKIILERKKFYIVLYCTNTYYIVSFTYMLNFIVHIYIVLYCTVFIPILLYCIVYRLFHTKSPPPRVKLSSIEGGVDLERNRWPEAKFDQKSTKNVLFFIFGWIYSKKLALKGGGT